MMRRLRQAALLCGLATLAAPADDLIGRPTTSTIAAGETLLDLARRYDLGFAEIVAANPLLDPWLPPSDSSVLLPTQHILPAGPRNGILINLAELRLYYFPADQSAALSYPLGIGREGWQTPLGTTRIARKRAHPGWSPTATERAEDADLPQWVPPGPDNPMGEYALYLQWPGYAIHGTNRPYSIGRRDSHGCIRLYPEDIAALYALVPTGASVTVVDQPAKAGWMNAELFLEIHPGQAGADALEAGERPPATSSPALEGWLRVLAGTEADRINWDTVRLTVQQQRGIPVQITSAHH
ncbi:MAG: L,D-transpeptidase family protein [Nevskia sp.]|nr:L,D-transpeptidase family protein [Nevskia sp.]